MSEPLEHDYIGLSESSSMERSSESSNFSTESEKTMLLTSKPPRSDLACLVSPKILKNTTAKLCLLIPSGKRGFSDVDVDVCENWGFNGGCDADSNNVSSPSALFSSTNVKNTGLEINQPAMLSPVMNQIDEKKKAAFNTENGSDPPVAK